MVVDVRVADAGEPNNANYDCLAVVWTQPLYSGSTSGDTYIASYSLVLEQGDCVFFLASAGTFVQSKTRCVKDVSDMIGFDVSSPFTVALVAVNNYGHASNVSNVSMSLSRPVPGSGTEPMSPQSGSVMTVTADPQRCGRMDVSWPPFIDEDGMQPIDHYVVAVYACDDPDTASYDRLGDTE